MKEKDKTIPCCRQCAAESHLSEHIEIGRYEFQWSVQFKCKPDYFPFIAQQIIYEYRHFGFGQVKI